MARLSPPLPSLPPLLDIRRPPKPPSETTLQSHAGGAGTGPEGEGYWGAAFQEATETFGYPLNGSMAGPGPTWGGARCAVLLVVLCWCWCCAVLVLVLCWCWCCVVLCAVLMPWQELPRSPFTCFHAACLCTVERLPLPSQTPPSKMRSDDWRCGAAVAAPNAPSH